MQTKSDLDVLGVHELRDIARNLGVKAPTTKKRDQLVDEILKIRSGELVGVTSKMGRPPKKHGGSLSSLTSFLSQKAAVNLGYENIEPVEMKYCDGEVSAAISPNEYIFEGVVREFEAQLYVRNYNYGAKHIILDRQDGINIGDMVKGEAVNYSSGFGSAQKAEKIAYLDDSSESQTRLEILANNNEMHKRVHANKSENRIVVELEANQYLCKDYCNCGVFLHTHECDDICESFNTLLDVKNVIHNLTRENKKFTLFMIDVEYIYSTLVTYYQMKGETGEVNASQYFKEILNMVNQSCGGKLVLFGRSSLNNKDYFKNALIKYCKYCELD